MIRLDKRAEYFTVLFEEFILTYLNYVIVCAKKFCGGNKI